MSVLGMYVFAYIIYMKSYACYDCAAHLFYLLLVWNFFLVTL